MKVLPVYMFLMFLSYGCGEDNPTAPVPTLDTTMKEQPGGSYPINEWDGDNWIDTGFLLNVKQKDWRFISHSDREFGGVSIKGGYTVGTSNPTDNDVLYKISKIVFKDVSGIPITESVYFDKVERIVRANSDDNYAGSFELHVDNLDVANQITQMSLWGSASKRNF